MRLYLDTSVYGGYFDTEFETWTKPLFECIGEGLHSVIRTPLVELELLGAPVQVQELYASLPKAAKEAVVTNLMIDELALEYIRARVVGESSMADCQHIALATLINADVLVSWNFKHIVNVTRIRGYNSVNMRHGLRLLDIRTPIELLAHEK